MAAMMAGEPVRVTPSGIAADSLGASLAGKLMFPIAKAYVDSVALVSGCRYPFSAALFVGDIASRHRAGRRDGLGPHYCRAAIARLKASVWVCSFAAPIPNLRLSQRWLLERHDAPPARLHHLEAAEHRHMRTPHLEVELETLDLGIVVRHRQWPPPPCKQLQHFEAEEVFRRPAGRPGIQIQE